MRNKFFRLAVVAVVLSVTICGCQKAPESTANGGIQHAKGAEEDQVEKIIEAGGAASSVENDMQEINCTIGTSENAIRIQAQMLDVPTNTYIMVLQENNSLTKELLIDFLESDSGNITDLSEKAQKEVEQYKTDNKQGEEYAVYSVFGTDSIYEVSDGQKVASFTNGTSAYYGDENLKEKCSAIYKSGNMTVWREAEIAEATGDSEFTVKEAENILLKKLLKINVTEIHVYEIGMYQKDDVMFYEIAFTPSYEGMGVAHEFGSISAGEIQPQGMAWVCEDGVAEVRLSACMGKVEQQEKCGALLSWGQVEKILEVYLNNGKIEGSNSKQGVLENVEFLYYPVFDEEKNKLELIPVWHICTPISMWIEDEDLSEQFGTNGAAWNIYINAVSGEIVRVE